MGDLTTLTDLIRSKGRIAVAFSGGRDSTLVSLAAAKALGSDARLFMAVNETIPGRDLDDARWISKSLGLELIEVTVNVFDEDGFTDNPINRCGICKRKIMSTILEEAAGFDIDIVADGAVMEDLGDFRPGHIEADKLGIWHPLIEAGIGKSDVERILKSERIPIWNKSASPCLASRIPFGQKITAGKLEIVDRIETAIIRLGFRQVRLRLHERTDGIFIGIVEVDDILKAVSMWNEITGSAGEVKLALDPRGYRMGSLHEGLAKK